MPNRILLATARERDRIKLDHANARSERVSGSARSDQIKPDEIRPDHTKPANQTRPDTDELGMKT